MIDTSCGIHHRIIMCVFPITVNYRFHKNSNTGLPTEPYELDIDELSFYREAKFGRLFIERFRFILDSITGLREQLSFNSR